MFDSCVFKEQLHYPEQKEVILEFDNIKKPLTVKQIKINGLITNIFYNTFFTFKNSNETISSVQTIEKDGIFKLKIDDLYLRSLRSSNWHCSQKKEDFIFNYEFTRSSFVEKYRDRNHIGFDKKFIPCFGCSNTYGAHQPDTDTWPYLLHKKTGKNFLNLGVRGSGIDAIFNNLKLLYQKHQYNQAYILFPAFERRIVRAQIENLWLRIFSTVRIFDIKESWHFFSNKILHKKMEKVKKNILQDNLNQYSKKFLVKILNFCKKNQIKLYCSSWSDDVYTYLQNFEQLHILPTFPKLSMFNDRADDGIHPHKKHYQYFVDQIANNW